MPAFSREVLPQPRAEQVERPESGHELDMIRKNQEAGRSTWKVVEEKYQKILAFQSPLSRLHKTLQLKISLLGILTVAQG